MIYERIFRKYFHAFFFRWFGWWFFQGEDDRLTPVMAAVLVGRLSVCGGRQAAGVFSGGGRRASYSVSRQLARVNGLVRGKPPPPRPPSGPASNPVATAVVRFGGKGWDLLLKLSDHMKMNH